MHVTLIYLNIQLCKQLGQGNLILEHNDNKTGE